MNDEFGRSERKQVQSILKVLSQLLTWKD